MFVLDQPLLLRKSESADTRKKTPFKPLMPEYSAPGLRRLATNSKLISASG